MLNDNLVINHIKEPYRIWVIDHFLNEDIVKQAKDNWLENDSPTWNGTRATVAGKENILENNMLNVSDINSMPTFIAAICSYLHSKEFTEWVEEKTKVENLIPDNTCRWSGMRVMREGSFQLIHSDAREHPENGLRKELTCLLYFNDDYEKDRDQGCLEIWNDDMTQRTHEIEPIDNRLVIFENSDTSYHGVPCVKKDRKAITFSILKDQISSGRKFAKFVGRPEDSQEINELGALRAMGDK